MNSIERIFHPSRRIHSMAAALELALLALLAGWVLTTWRYPAGDFLNNAWAPARLLWLGGNSPYDQAAASQLLAGAATSPVLQAVWTPLALPLFLPLSFLPPGLAANLWFLAQFAWLLMAAALLSRSKAAGPRSLLALTVLMLFPPALNALMLGQVTAFAVVVLVAGALAADRGRVRLAGFLMAWALIKPQLTPLILLALGVWVWQGRRLRQLLIGGSCGLVTGLGPIIALRPTIAGEYVSALRTNPQWLHASLPALVREATGKAGAGYATWLILATAVLWVTYRVWQVLPFRPAVAWTLALTLLVTPYVWSWDQVLLLPLMGHVSLSTRGWQAAGWWIGLALIAGGYLWIGLRVQNASHWYTWVPYAVMALAWGMRDGA